MVYKNSTWDAVEVGSKWVFENKCFSFPLLIFAMYVPGVGAFDWLIRPFGGALIWTPFCECEQRKIIMLKAGGWGGGVQGGC